MSKASPLVNGENNCGGGDFGNANVNMVAIMDSRSNKTQDFPSNQDKSAKMYSCDFDHMYASVNDVSCAVNQVKDKETKHLKELLLLHLDLIQQQSEQIVTKDKQIASLKQDYETLKMRFDRMERRVTLKRHRGSAVEQINSNNSPQSSCSNSVVVQSEAEVKSSLGTVSKEEGEQLRDSTEGSMVRRRICKRISQEGDFGKKRRMSTGSGTFGRKKRTISVNSDKIKQCSDVYCGETDKKVKERLKLKTDSAYYTIVGEFDSCWSTCETRNVSTEEQVQVPTWREKPIAPCYVMEGTENLGDDVFSKRHQRLEIDERRRKRWDIQRIREQNHVDKLKQKLNKNQNLQSSEHPLSSFFPSIDDLEEISIEDQLPVLAFGLEIPLFENRAPRPLMELVERAGNEKQCHEYFDEWSGRVGSGGPLCLSGSRTCSRGSGTHVEEFYVCLFAVSSVSRGAFTFKKSRSRLPARGGCLGPIFCPLCESVIDFLQRAIMTSPGMIWLVKDEPVEAVNDEGVDDVHLDEQAGKSSTSSSFISIANCFRGVFGPVLFF